MIARGMFAAFLAPCTACQGDRHSCRGSCSGPGRCCVTARVRCAPGQLGTNGMHAAIPARGQRPGGQRHRGAARGSKSGNAPSCWKFWIRARRDLMTYARSGVGPRRARDSRGSAGSSEAKSWISRRLQCIRSIRRRIQQFIRVAVPRSPWPSRPLAPPLRLPFHRRTQRRHSTRACVPACRAEGRSDRRLLVPALEQAWEQFLGPTRRNSVAHPGPSLTGLGTRRQREPPARPGVLLCPARATDARCAPFLPAAN